MGHFFRNWETGYPDPVNADPYVLWLTTRILLFFMKKRPLSDRWGSWASLKAEMKTITKGGKPYESKSCGRKSCG